MLSGGVVALVGAVAGFAAARNSSAADDNPNSTANAYGAPAAKNGGGPDVVAPVSEVTGEGIVAEGIVLTRTPDGGVHGLSATCTHQGCTVGKPSNGVVSCPCHGSIFDARTGRVMQGPATQPLPEVPVSIQGNDVVRG